MSTLIASLVFEDREVHLDQRVTTIGRSQGNDVVVSEIYVSSTHAEIERQGDDFVLRDLNSTNGTYVNGHETREPYVLRNGDKVSLAKVCNFTFRSDKTTALLPEKRGLHIDENMRRVTVDGCDVNLSQLQYRLVRCLHEKAGQPCSRDEIITHVWGGSGVGISDAAIDSLVNRVREHIAAIDPDHEYIVTMRGYGFRLQNK